MKKRCLLILTAVAAFVFSLTFAGCKSNESERIPDVHPLSVIRAGNSIYLQVPVQSHKKIMESIILYAFEDISEKDAGTIVNHVDTLYVGATVASGNEHIDVVAEGRFPAIALNAVFTKKNGWNKKNYEAVSSEYALSRKYQNKFEVYSRDDTGLGISFPTNKFVCASNDIDSALELYSLREPLDETDVNGWLTQESEDIKFFVTNPDDYISQITGDSLSISCENVCGFLRYVGKSRDGRKNDCYKLIVNLNLENKNVVRSTKTLMTIALGMKGFSVKQNGERTIEITSPEVNFEDFMSGQLF